VDDEHKSLMPGSDRVYGWIRSDPDPDDRMYAVPPQVVAAAPPAIDLSLPTLPKPFEPSLNQAAQGSCGPHTAAEDLIFAMLRQDNLGAAVLPSVRFIYWCTRMIMGTTNEDSGVDNRSLGLALQQFGWCDEEKCPYQGGDFTAMRTKPSQEAFDQAAERKIQAVFGVPADTDTMCACLSNGDTFWVGCKLYPPFESQRTGQTGIVDMPIRGMQPIGGHDMLCVGYNRSSAMFGDIPPGYFKLKNHWYSGGVPWGANGYCFMPINYLINPNISGSYYTVRHSYYPVVAPPTPPVPPVPPTPIPPSPTGRHVITTTGETWVDGVKLK